MNKAELINAIAKKVELPKKDVDLTVNTLLDVVTEALASGDKIQLVGFGTLEVRKRAARKGRNPKTNQEIDIPETKTPAFKAGKNLKDIVNGK